MAIDPALRKLFDELLADPRYVDGRKSFPRTLTVDDAVRITAHLHDEMDEFASARAEAARRALRPLACKAGCNACCEELVMVFRPEAVRVARWLELAGNAAAKQAFLAAYPAWKARVGDASARHAAVFASGDDAAFLAVHVEQWQKRILCAFNQGGKCTVYPVRPLLCRDAHAIGTADHCAGDDTSGIPPVRMQSDQLDGFMGQARGRLRAAHHAIGGPRMQPMALCDAVYELLDKPPGTGATGA